MLEVLVTQVGCVNGQCAQTVQISPTVAVYAVEAPIYRPRLFQGLLRKERAVPVLILTTPEPEKAKKKANK